VTRTQPTTEILIRLHRNLGDLRIEEGLDAFAYRIARNAVIDYYRSRGSSPLSRSL
jgi:DNA-directed RNA polymerase specialized sigma24 family protein